MKQAFKSISTRGVTLLEIMLVLAVAAMIILMSVRYYQSATSNQQANSALQQIQGITASADTLAQSSGSYAAANVSTTTLAPLLPGGAANAFTTPWGTTITIGAITGSSYTVTLPATPAAVCTILTSRLRQNVHFSNVQPATCPATAGNVSYVYLANP